MKNDGDSLNRLFAIAGRFTRSLHTLPFLCSMSDNRRDQLCRWQINSTLTTYSAACPLATVLSYALAQRLRRLHERGCQADIGIMAFVQQTLSAIPLIQTLQPRVIPEGISRSCQRARHRGRLLL